MLNGNTTYATSAFRRFPVHLIFIFGITVFYIAFILVFQPHNLISFLGGTGFGYTFNLSITSAILFSVLLSSRTVYYLFRRKIISNASLCLWSFMESVIGCAFIAMFFSLSGNTGLSYFDFLYRTLALYLPLLLIPYSIIISVISMHGLANSRTEERPSGSRMKFYDSSHLLKFSSTDSAILYIEAGENYVRINYEQNGAIREHVLRAPMKSLEEMCRLHGIMRCHRSFFVNVRRINVLRKDKDGFIYIELDNSDARHIPVSKTYYDQIASSL